MADNDRPQNSHSTDEYYHQQTHPANSSENFPIPYHQTPTVSFSTFPHSTYFISPRQPISSNTLPGISDFTDPFKYIPYPSYGNLSSRRESLPEFNPVVTMISTPESNLTPLPTGRHISDSIPNVYMTRQYDEYSARNPEPSHALSKAPVAQTLNIVPQLYTTQQDSHLCLQDHQHHIQVPAHPHCGFGSSPHVHVAGAPPQSGSVSPYGIHSNLSNQSVVMSTETLIFNQSTPEDDSEEHTSDDDEDSRNTDNVNSLDVNNIDSACGQTLNPIKQHNCGGPLVLFKLLGRLEICDRYYPKSVAIQTETIPIKTDCNSREISEPSDSTKKCVESPIPFNVLSTNDLQEYENAEEIMSLIKSEQTSSLDNGSIAEIREIKLTAIKEEKIGNDRAIDDRQHNNRRASSPAVSYPSSHAMTNIDRIPEMVDSLPIIASLQSPGMTQPTSLAATNISMVPGMVGSLPTSAFKGKDKHAEMERMEINVRIDDSQFVAVGDGPKRWQCSQCPKSYTTKHNLVTHVLDHNGIKPHLCMLCGKYFKQLSHLNTHMLTHENIKQNICQVCGKGFTQVSHLKRHQAVHLESKPHICEICKHGFAYPSELRIHAEKHAPGKDSCLECHDDLGNPKLLKEHLPTHEVREDHDCPECNRLFKYPSQLKDHLTSHSGHRPFICSECGMDFIKEHHLKAHQFTHTGLRPYECPQCGRSFNQRANVVRHQLIHKNYKAYKCDECDKSFTQPQTLKAHMVVHAKKKPHQCHLCGKEFGRQHNLQAHMHMHSDSKPFLCFCGSSFTLKGNLKRHKKVKHGIDDNTESLEEEAVSFLNTMSNVRANQGFTATLPPDNGQDSDDFEFDLVSSDGKLQKKQRKSTPHRIPQSDLDEDNSPDGTDQKSKFFTTNQEQESGGHQQTAIKRRLEGQLDGGEDVNWEKKRMKLAAEKTRDVSVEDYENDIDKDSDTEWTPSNKPRVVKCNLSVNDLAAKYSRSKVS